MTTMTNEDHIKNVISKTFDVIKSVYKSQKDGLTGQTTGDTGSRIIFPNKRKNDETRVSEQELRFIFVEQLNLYLQTEEGKSWNVYYSVETPTKGEYGFSNPDKKESGNIDLTIHDSKFNRIAIIEFKANNPRKQSYQKDFEKLTNEPTVPNRYFIQILENINSGTVPNIKKEKVFVKNDMVNRWGDNNFHFICHSLSSEAPLIDEVLNKSHKNME